MKGDKMNNRAQTKPELMLKIKQLENKIIQLQKHKTELIEYIKKHKIPTEEMEDIIPDLTSNQWKQLIQTFIVNVSKKSGILNIENKGIDWLDVKPSVYHKRIVSKVNNLRNMDDMNDTSLISKLLCLKMFMFAYEDIEFQTLWRNLSKII
jgi:hypothetical protein